MPGGKQSKSALFEEFDFNIYNDDDRIAAYMTDKDGVPLWMKCIDEHYTGLEIKKMSGRKFETSYENFVATLKMLVAKLIEAI